MGRARAALRRRVRQRTDPLVVRRFHELFYTSGVWNSTRWQKVPVLKNPIDLWVYQEILVDTQPELIVETGTHSGGSALFLASMCDLAGRGEVVSIDIRPEREDYPRHPRITYLADRSSTDPAVVAEVEARSAGKRTMIVLDSDHSQRHVEDELAAYARLVTEGCYLIVEDSNIGPIRPDLMPGPMEAIDRFLASTSEFEVDASRERYFLTFNPRGYLRRVAPPAAG